MASILRLMYGASFVTAFGLTENCCISTGIRPLASKLTTISPPRAMAGKTALRSQILASTAAAMFSAMKNSPVFAGSAALTSV